MFFEFLYWTVGRLIKWIFRLQPEGLENLPRHGVLLCPNHASNWDPVLIGVCLPHNYHLRIMAKEALALLGKCERAFRLPLCETTDANLAQLKGTLAACGLL